MMIRRNTYVEPDIAQCCPSVRTFMYSKASRYTASRSADLGDAQFLTLKHMGGAAACHFSQDHTMFARFLDFINKHPD
jgi:hypothetical protein